MARFKQTAFITILGALLSSQVAGACILGGDGGDPQDSLQAFDRLNNQEPSKGGDGTDPRSPGRGGDGTDPRGTK